MQPEIMKSSNRPLHPNQPNHPIIEHPTFPLKPSTYDFISNKNGTMSQTFDEFVRLRFSDNPTINYHSIKENINSIERLAPLEMVGLLLDFSDCLSINVFDNLDLFAELMAHVDSIAIYNGAQNPIIRFQTKLLADLTSRYVPVKIFKQESAAMAWLKFRAYNISA